MNCALLPATAAQALAINGDLMSRQFRQTRAHPLAKRLSKGIALDAFAHIAQGIMRGYAV